MRRVETQTSKEGSKVACTIFDRRKGTRRTGRERKKERERSRERAGWTTTTLHYTALDDMAPRERGEQTQYKARETQNIFPPGLQRESKKAATHTLFSFPPRVTRAGRQEGSDSKNESSTKITTKNEMRELTVC